MFGGSQVQGKSHPSPSVWVRTSVLDYGIPRKCLNAPSKCRKLGKICKSGE